MVRAKNPMNSKTNWSINLIYHPIIFTNFRNRVSKNFIDQKVASDSLLKCKIKKYCMLALFSLISKSYEGSVRVYWKTKL